MVSFKNLLGSRNLSQLGLQEMPLPVELADLMAKLFPEPVLVLDKTNHRIVWASPGMMLLTGYDGKQLRTLDARKLIEQFFEPFEEVMALYEQGAPDGQFSVRFRAPGGEKVVLGVWMRLPDDVRGSETFMLMLRDVTEIEQLRQELLQYSEELQQQLDANRALVEERERAYQKLREQTEKLRLISTATAYSNTMKFILTPDGTIVWVNRLFEQASGWSASELIGKNVRDIGGSFAHLLYSPDAKPTEETLITRHFHRAPFTEEIFAYDRQGRGYWMLLTVAPVPNELGETTHYLGALINIHKKKQREEELRRFKEEIEQSLTYAARIQRRFMTPVERLRGYFSAAEVWYEPIIGVGGDFYQFEPVENGIVVALGDCTGHGVPASMLSIYAATALRFALERFRNDLEAIYRQLRADVQEIFGGDRPLHEGFELAMLWYEPSSGRAAYVGAGRPLWLLRRGNIIPVFGGRGDISVTASFHSSSKEAVLQTLTLQRGDRLYLFSDGVTDQLNAEGKRFSKSRLQSFLQTSSYLPLSEQVDMLRHTLRQWSLNAPQTDDLLLIAMEV